MSLFAAPKWRWGALVKQSGGAFLMFSSRPSSARPPHSLILRCSFDGLCGSCPRREGGSKGGGSSPRSLPTIASLHTRLPSSKWPPLDKGWGSHTGSVASGCSVATLADAHARFHAFPFATGSGSWHHIAQHTSLSGSLAVCFPLQDVVHFLRSLCFKL